MLAASRLSIPTEERPGEAVGGRQCQGHHKRTDEGLPVHSFQSLLGDLATIIRNIMALNDQSDATKVAEPPLSGTRLFIRKSCVRGARPVLVFNSLMEDSAWNKKSPVVERRCGPFPFSALRWRGRRRV